MVNIPKPPKFSLLAIGPGLVLIAMGLGSGEFVLWPYLVAQYGFGIIWGAIVGITLQYFVSNEAGRYTLATGGSVYTGFHKLNRYIPYWFIVSTFASFAWPGIIGSGGQILGHLLNIEDHKWITIGLLIVIGLLLTFGGKVYNNLERFQKLFVAIAIPILILITVLLVNPDNINQFAKGVVGIGEGYFLLPSNISLMAFLGAVAYSGAAGNLVLSHSFYVQDEGLGMAKNLTTQIDRRHKDNEVPVGKVFDMTKENITNFKGWFRNSSKEQFISFLCLGLLAIFLLAYISYSLVYPFNGEEGLGFIFLQKDVISSSFGAILGTFFLITGVIFLFTTQLGIFETTSRIMTENLQLASDSLRKRYSRTNIFYFFLWLQVISASIISYFGLEQPIQILILGTFFSALSMFVLSIFVLWLNRSELLPKEIQPNLFRKLMLAISFIFFGVFVVFTILDVV